MSSLAGQISPPGARHKSGGWRVLSMPLSDAREAVERPNGPEVWNALLTEFAAEFSTDRQHVDNGLVTELDDVGVPWVPRLGGRAPLGAELDHVARTGRWDRSRYPGRSEARMAVLSAAVARGWQLDDVREAIASGAWRGFPGLYERRSEPGRLERLGADVAEERKVPPGVPLGAALAGLVVLGLHRVLVRAGRNRVRRCRRRCLDRL